MNVITSFENVSGTSAYQMAISLGKLASSPSGIPDQFLTYLFNSFNTYKKLAKEKDFPLDKFVPQIDAYYAKFRGARTWNDVVNSFDSINFLSSDSDIPNMHILAVQEHFENIVLEAVDNKVHLDVKALSSALKIKDAIDLIEHIILLVKNGMNIDSADTMVKETFHLLQI
jgi:hypothetical protein